MLDTGGCIPYGCVKAFAVGTPPACYVPPAPPSECGQVHRKGLSGTTPGQDGTRVTSGGLRDGVADGARTQPYPLKARGYRGRVSPAGGGGGGGGGGDYAPLQSAGYRLMGGIKKIGDSMCKVGTPRAGTLTRPACSLTNVNHNAAPLAPRAGTLTRPACTRTRTFGARYCRASETDDACRSGAGTDGSWAGMCVRACCGWCPGMLWPHEKGLRPDSVHSRQDSTSPVPAT